MQLVIQRLSAEAGYWMWYFITGSQRGPYAGVTVKSQKQPSLRRLADRIVQVYWSCAIFSIVFWVVNQTLTRQTLIQDL